MFRRKHDIQNKEDKSQKFAEKVLFVGVPVSSAVLSYFLSRRSSCISRLKRAMKICKAVDSNSLFGAVITFDQDYEKLTKEIEKIYSQKNSPFIFYKEPYLVKAHNDLIDMRYCLADARILLARIDKEPNGYLNVLSDIKSSMEYINSALDLIADNLHKEDDF